MKWESGDLKVGIVVLAALALLLGGVLWLTPTVTDHSVALYTQYERIDGLAEQAPVELAGYTIGRVDDITPHRAADGAIVFRVRMKVDWRGERGEAIPIPQGTLARLMPPPVTGTAFLAGFIQLEPPPQRGLPSVRGGDTLVGVRAVAAVEQLQGVAGDMTRQVSATLASAQRLIDSLSRTTGLANRLVAHTDTLMPHMVAELETRLATADTLMRDLRVIAPAAVRTMDSTQAIISDSRRLVADVDRTLASRDPQMGRVLANLDTTTALLNHFVREVTRNPGRMISGVKPPARLDPERAAKEAAERDRKRCGRSPCTAAAEDTAGH